MEVRVERMVEIWFPDYISGPPMGCKSAVRRAAMFLATLKE
jgi:hypothetical protein